MQNIALFTHSTFNIFTDGGSIVFVEKPDIVRPCVVPTVSATLGRNVTLSCPARGQPAVIWTWTRGGQIIRSGGRITLLDDGEELLITTVEAADAGLYNCTVENAVGNETFSDNYTIQLDVQGKKWVWSR